MALNKEKNVLKDVLGIYRHSYTKNELQVDAKRRIKEITDMSYTCMTVQPKKLQKCVTSICSMVCSRGKR